MLKSYFFDIQLSKQKIIFFRLLNFKYNGLNHASLPHCTSK